MLSGKVAIVTGASRGIGRETALTLAGYGATVIVNYCGSKDKAEAVEKRSKQQAVMQKHIREMSLILMLRKR